MLFTTGTRKFDPFLILDFEKISRDALPCSSLNVKSQVY